MADDREVQEQVTKLRLKVLKEKIAAEKQRGPASFKGSLFPAASTDPHIMLQTEILRSEQLLQNVKSPREMCILAQEYTYMDLNDMFIDKWLIDWLSS